MGAVFKVIRIILLLLVLALAALAAMNWSTVRQIAKFSPLILPSFYGAPASEAEARAQDIRYLRDLTKYDRSFSEDEHQSFDRLMDDLDARSGTMTTAELYLGAARAAALSDNGHTNISASSLYREFNRVGVKIFWFSDGLFAVRADDANKEIVGSRIVAIDGMPVEDVLASLSSYHGGAPQWRKLYTPLMMESPEIMHAAGLAASPDKLTYTLEDNDSVRDVELPGATNEGQSALPTRRPWMTLKPVALPDENNDWARALSDTIATPPLYLRESDNPYFWSDLEGGVYIRTQTTFDAEGLKLQSFFDEALSGYGEGELDYMVVDLRWNPGGDYTQAIDFAKAVPQKIKEDGHLYIVVGPQTFSAAVVSAAMLKFYGGEKSVIVGAPMGDDEQFWAERGMGFTLPNSKYSINYATGYHDWENGCEGHPYCFSQNLIHQVPAGSLLPTVTIEPTYADYASGRDAVMDWIQSEQQTLNGQSPVAPLSEE